MNHDSPAENQDYVGLLLAGAFNAMSAANWLDVGKFPNQSADADRQGPYGHADEILKYCLDNGVITPREGRTADEAFEAMTMIFPCSTADVWDNYTFRNGALLRMSDQHARSVARSAASVAFRVVCDSFEIHECLDEVSPRVADCVGEVELAMRKLVKAVQQG